MKRFLKIIAWLAAVHATALGLQTLFRVMLLVAVSGQLTDDVRGDVGLYLTAFVRGLWFDNVIGCYLLIAPLVFVGLAAVAGIAGRRTLRAAATWFGVMYVPVFMAAAGNIPYFVYFTKPLNSSIWNWAEYGTQTLGMMLGEPSWWLYILSFFLFVAAFAALLYAYGRIWQRWMSHDERRTTWQLVGLRLLVWLPLVGLCFFGIRGRTGYNPIKVSAAYFCGSPVLNQLGVNPTFCLLNTTLDDQRGENRRLSLMPDAEAVENAQRLLGRSGIEGISPLARRVEREGAPLRKNIVVIMMESMSAKLMTRFGNEKNLTPTLDSLWQRSLAFPNFYSAGVHTNHGIYATLYSFPSIMKRNAMKGSAIPTYSGLPTVLKDAGYHNLFFMTHESQYDNMNAFFRSNGFDEIYAEENYPREERANHFGVPDHYLFDYALPVLRQKAAEDKPFFATLLTITNHPPYAVPEWFTPRHAEAEWQVVEYADASINRFMTAAEKEDWFDNTLFVFVGDHGKMMGHADSELPESYNHVPFFIYGKEIAPAEHESFAMQVDIAPTLLGLLNVSYVQNNFGVDLLQEARPYTFYTADNTVAARDSLRLFVHNPDAARDFCYDLSGGTPVETQETPEFKKMKTYCFSMLQAAENLVEQGATIDKAKK